MQLIVPSNSGQGTINSHLFFGLYPENHLIIILIKKSLLLALLSAHYTTLYHKVTPITIFSVKLQVLYTLYNQITNFYVHLLLIFKGMHMFVT